MPDASIDRRRLLVAGATMGVGAMIGLGSDASATVAAPATGAQRAGAFPR